MPGGQFDQRADPGQEDKSRVFKGKQMCKPPVFPGWKTRKCLREGRLSG